MKKFTHEDGSSITLSAKDSDILIVTFHDNNKIQLSEIKLRGRESDAVIKWIKGRL